MTNRLDRETVLGIIERIYAASCDVELWPDVAIQCQALFPGCGFSILLSNADHKLDAVSCGAGYDPRSIEEYIAHYHAMNPYLPIIETLQSDQVAHAKDLVTRDWLMEKPFYHEWLKPAGDLIHGVTLPIRRNGSEHLLRLTFDIPDSRSEAEALASELLKLTTTHFRRAFEMSWRLRQAGELSDMGHALLAQLKGAVLIVDETAKIAGANEAAVALLQDGRALRAKANRLSFLAARADSEFQRVLQAAVSIDAAPAPSGFLVDLDRSATPVVVLPLVQSAGRQNGGAHKRWALVQIGTEAPSAPPTELLRALYNLTRAEAGVVQRVAAGDSIKDIADSNENSQSTVRNQLQSAMQKLAVHRQAELVGVLASLTPQLDASR